MKKIERVFAWLLVFVLAASMTCGLSAVAAASYEPDTEAFIQPEVTAESEVAAAPEAEETAEDDSSAEPAVTRRASRTPLTAKKPAASPRSSQRLMHRTSRYTRPTCARTRSNSCL